MPSNDIIAVISSREKEWMQAWIDKDEDIFNDVLAEDFLLCSARGVFMSKEEWMKAALDAFTCEQFLWKELKIRIYGEVAVVNAMTFQKARVGQQDWSGDFIITDVWVHKDGKWQVVSRQGTGPLTK